MYCIYILGIIMCGLVFMKNLICWKEVEDYIEPVGHYDICQDSPREQYKNMGINGRTNSSSAIRLVRKKMDRRNSL